MSNNPNNIRKDKNMNTNNGHKSMKNGSKSNKKAENPFSKKNYYGDKGLHQRFSEETNENVNVSNNLAQPIQNINHGGPHQRAMNSYAPVNGNYTSPDDDMAYNAATLNDQTPINQQLTAEEWAWIQQMYNNDNSYNDGYGNEYIMSSPYPINSSYHNNNNIVVNNNNNSYNNSYNNNGYNNNNNYNSVYKKNYSNNKSIDSSESKSSDIFVDNLGAVELPFNWDKSKPKPKKLTLDQIKKLQKNEKIYEYKDGFWQPYLVKSISIDETDIDLILRNPAWEHIETPIKIKEGYGKLPIFYNNEHNIDAIDKKEQASTQERLKDYERKYGNESNQASPKYQKFDKYNIYKIKDTKKTELDPKKYKVGCAVGFTSEDDNYAEGTIMDYNRTNSYAAIKVKTTNQIKILRLDLCHPILIQKSSRTVTKLDRNLFKKGTIISFTSGIAEMVGTIIKYDSLTSECTMVIGNSTIETRLDKCKDIFILNVNHYEWKGLLNNTIINDDMNWSQYPNSLLACIRTNLKQYSVINLDYSSLMFISGIGFGFHWFNAKIEANETDLKKREHLTFFVDDSKLNDTFNNIETASKIKFNYNKVMQNKISDAEDDIINSLKNNKNGVITHDKNGHLGLIVGYTPNKNNNNVDSRYLFLIKNMTKNSDNDSENNDNNNNNDSNNKWCYKSDENIFNEDAFSVILIKNQEFYIEMITPEDVKTNSFRYNIKHKGLFTIDNIKKCFENIVNLYEYTGDEFDTFGKEGLQKLSTQLETHGSDQFVNQFISALIKFYDGRRTMNSFFENKKAQFKQLKGFNNVSLQYGKIIEQLNTEIKHLKEYEPIFNEYVLTYNGQLKDTESISDEDLNRGKQIILKLMSSEDEIMKNIKEMLKQL